MAMRRRYFGGMTQPQQPGGPPMPMAPEQGGSGSPYMGDPGVGPHGGGVNPMVANGPMGTPPPPRPPQPPTVQPPLPGGMGPITPQTAAALTGRGGPGAMPGTGMAMAGGGGGPLQTGSVGSPMPTNTLLQIMRLLGRA